MDKKLEKERDEFIKNGGSPDEWDFGSDIADAMVDGLNESVKKEDQ